jgi:hypothetical protein
MNLSEKHIDNEIFSGVIRKENILIYDDNQRNKGFIIKTKKNINDIENIINNILDKYQDKCKYCININDAYYSISFNVGLNQLDAMMETIFLIYIYKSNIDLGIIKLVHEKEEHPEWTPIKNDLIREFQ